MVRLDDPATANALDALAIDAIETALSRAEETDADETIRLGLAVPYRADLIDRIHATETDARTRIKSLVSHGLLGRLRRERAGNFAAWTGSINGLT